MTSALSSGMPPIRNAAPLQSNRLYIVEAVTMGRSFVSGQWYEKPVLLTLRELGGSAFSINTLQIEQNLISADAWQ